jgi:hypothetical protein
MRTEEEVRAETIERLAALEHEQWLKWAYEIGRTEDLSEERIGRWNRLFLTPYDALTEEEKEQDREWARKAYEICLQSRGFEKLAMVLNYKDGG